jgi:hypothetical protein
MIPRSAPIISAVIALLVVAACAGSAVTPAATPAVPSAPTGMAPDPTPIVTQRPTIATPDATPIIGGVDGAAGGPELTIEAVDEDTVRATLVDPSAKAWRVVVTGTGELGGDRWEIAVETGDVAPVITATEVRDGEVVDVLDLSGFFDGTAAAGGCHSALPVCLDSNGFRLPEGDGRFSVLLDLPEAQVPLVIRGGTARWDGEPFILGDWTETEAFPWGEG